MFGLEGSGFIVAIAVTLLLAGAIVYYCNTRITAMEKAIVKQNQVLADFIGNVRNTLTNVPAGGGPVQSQNVVANGATQEAVDAANDYYSNTTPEQKIEVSDDSQSEDDSDSESDSDSDSDLDSDDEDTKENEKIQEVSENIAVSDLLNVVNDNLEIGVIGIKMTPPDGPPPPEISGPEITQLTEINEIDEITPPQDEIKTIKLGDVKDEEELDSVTLNSETLSSVSNGSSDEDEEEEDTSTVNSHVVTELNDESVMKLKVARLRELAVELGLGSEDSIKKTKKAALQEMIKNKINNNEE